MLQISRELGWPVRIGQGFFFVSLREDRSFFAGDTNAFAPTLMNTERNGSTFLFAWIEVGAGDGERYKFVSAASNGSFTADPNSRSYSFDNNGEMSFTSRPGISRVDYPTQYERHLDLDLPNDDALKSRNVRILMPASTATRVLYVHDGQNVFARDSSIPDGYAIPFGGWGLDENAPADLMIVAIDNTADRVFDYTHVPDTIDSGGAVGGGADRYADFIQLVVRPLVDDLYGEPAVVGTMGSSLGGLVSLAIADRYPDDFDFAAGLSSTFGWGSFNNVGSSDGDSTLIDRYRSADGAGVRHTVLYVDSGGDNGGGCIDADGDGINDDDGEADDNFCETKQMFDVLIEAGYTPDNNVFYVYDAGPGGNGDAEHNELAWGFRAANNVLPLFGSLF